jgi:hypothetical protein
MEGIGKEALETAIMSADLTRHHIPIDVEEFKEMSDETKQWVSILRDEFSGLKAWLTGPDGSGGVLDGIKEDLNMLERGQKQIEEQLSSIVNTQLRDRAEIEAKVDRVKHDVNNLGEKVRDNRDRIEGHCLDVEREKEAELKTRRFRVEVWVPVIAAIIGPLVIALILGGI